MTQGKIERYHRSLKNVVKLEHYYTPREVERAVGGFAEECNHRGDDVGAEVLVSATGLTRPGVAVATAPSPGPR